MSVCVHVSCACVCLHVYLCVSQSLLVAVGIHSVKVLGDSTLSIREKCLVSLVLTFALLCLSCLLEYLHFWAEREAFSADLQSDIQWKGRLQP